MDFGSMNSSSEACVLLENFWPKVAKDMQGITSSDFKNPELPLARIKKIMKLDDEVKMISAEAPIIFAKAAEIFIQEMTIRAWVHTEENKRRTLQKNDVSLAVSRYEQFDFLIDIVPREEIKPTKKEAHSPNSSTCVNTAATSAGSILGSDGSTSGLLNVIGGAANTSGILANQASNGNANAHNGNVQYFMTGSLPLQFQGLTNNMQGIQTIQGLQGLQNLQGAQIILNSNGQPTIFVGNRDC